MPRNVWASQGWWANAVDMGTALTDTDLFDRGGASIQTSQRYHDCLLSLLHGRASRTARSLPEQFSGTGVVPAIDRNDRLVLTAALAFSIDAGTGNAQFGFDPAGQASAIDSFGNHVLTAANDWPAGPVDGRFVLRIGAATWTFPTAAGRACDLTTLMRTQAQSTIGDAAADADANTSVTTCIEAADNAAYDAASKRIRWGIDMDCHVWSAWPAALAISDPDPTEAFAVLIGADGAEASVTVTDSNGDDYKLWRCNRRSPLALKPRFGLARPPERGHVVDRAQTELRSARVVGHERFRKLTRHFTWHAYGPGSVLDQHDETDAFLREFNEGIFYQQIGESRRAIPAAECNAASASGRTPYDLVYTSERDGERGRLHVTRAPTDPRSRTLGGWLGNHRKKRTESLEVNLVWQPQGVRWPVR